MPGWIIRQVPHPRDRRPPMPVADCSPVRRLVPLCLLPTPVHARFRPRTVPTASQGTRRAPPLLRASSTRAEARAATLQAAGVTSLNGIATALNARGVRTPRDHRHWYASQVSRLLKRLPA
jgi:hypothetical protein